MRRRLSCVLVLAVGAAVGAFAGDAARTPILPPELPWHGRSEALVLSPADRWATPTERSGLTRTPRYDETIAWLRTLEAAKPSQLRLASLGKSPEGRDLWMVIASKEGAFTPDALRATGKPTVFAQAGIHAGEIDGKDAGMMLLRDMTVRGTRADLLAGANFLFVPIYNVDGHERFSDHTRINQRGPIEAGWRTTSQSVNLNRDYAKLDAAESRAMVQALEAWRPDLYLDIHVTDGADYQYDITFGWNQKYALSPAIASWLDGVLQPAAARDLEAMGHIPGPLVQLVDDHDPSKGIIDWTSGPRYSNGYGDARHLPTILVENHSLKPFRQRVLGTYVLLDSVLRTVARDAAGLRRAIAADATARPGQIPLEWKPATSPSAWLDFKGVAWRSTPSPISGGPRVEWLGRPETVRLPRQGMKVTQTASRPSAWWIPPAWPGVIDRLVLQGIQLERLTAPRDVEVEMYRVESPRVESDPYDRLISVMGTFVVEKRRERFPAGSVRVSADQPLAALAALLLEPASPDSFFSWGFFPECLQATEGAEGYVMEPMAERMLAESPALKAEFEKALATDAAFAEDPQARLEWFYRRTPFHDDRLRLYPIAREP